MLSTPLKRKPSPQVDALKVFVARAEARALLWHTGEISLHDAVDELWQAAVTGGLVAKLGPDKVQSILADAFAPLRDDLLKAEDVVEAAPRERRVAASTLEAAEFLLREGNVERMCEWFDKHTPQERAEILDH